jgi:hypothetical protein
VRARAGFRSLVCLPEKGKEIGDDTTCDISDFSTEENKMLYIWLSGENFGEMSESS